MNSFLAGKGFTYCILGLYGLRCVSYALAGNWGRAMYWLSAASITVAAEFLVH